MNLRQRDSSQRTYDKWVADYNCDWKIDIDWNVEHVQGKRNARVQTKSFWNDVKIVSHLIETTWFSRRRFVWTYSSFRSDGFNGSYWSSRIVLLGFLFGSWSLPFQGFNVLSCTYSGGINYRICTNWLSLRYVQKLPLNMLITMLSFWKKADVLFVL